MSDKIGFGSNRLIIALPPCDLPTSVEWVVNLASMYWPLNVSREYSSQEGIGVIDSMDVVRNYTIGYAIGVNARYIWFLKNDILPPTWAVHRFLEAMRLDPKIMIIAGMCETNVPESTEFLDDVNQVFEDENGEQFEILDVAPNSYINLECTVVKVEAFDLIGEPWFNGSDLVSSEAYLCDRVMKAGYKVCAHTGVYCGKVDMITGKSHWPEGSVVAA